MTLFLSLDSPALCLSLSLWSSSVSVTLCTLSHSLLYGPALYLSVSLSLSLCPSLLHGSTLCPPVLLLTYPSLIPLSHRRVVPRGEIVNAFYRFFFVTSKPIINSPAFHCLPPQITSKKRAIVQTTDLTRPVRLAAGSWALRCSKDVSSPWRV
jgi:hypothetical protein